MKKADARRKGDPAKVAIAQAIALDAFCRFRLDDENQAKSFAHWIKLKGLSRARLPENEWIALLEAFQNTRFL